MGRRMGGQGGGGNVERINNTKTIKKMKTYHDISFLKCKHMHI